MPTKKQATKSSKKPQIPSQNNKSHILTGIGMTALTILFPSAVIRLVPQPDVQGFLFGVSVFIAIGGVIASTVAAVKTREGVRAIFGLFALICALMVVYCMFAVSFY